MAEPVRSKAEKPVRSKAEIEAELAAARDRVAENLAQLIGSVSPKAIVANSVTEARTLAESNLAQAKEQLVDSAGRLRTDRVVLAAAAVAGSVAFVLIVRGIFKSR